MRNYFSNTGYFLKETMTLIRLSLVSSLMSLVSTALIFFMLALVISGWLTSNHVSDVIQSEAEINVYYQETQEDGAVLQLLKQIQSISGVRDARLVEEREAYQRMEKILGDEASVLKVFDENPFSSFIEVRINLSEIEQVLKEINGLSGVEHVRNNQEVLERLSHISGMIKLIGSLVLLAVGISTLVIIAHMIRLGIHNNREQIKTLRLLGAPEIFLAIPFMLEGLVITLGGGVLAIFFAGVTILRTYVEISGNLSFIPLVPSGLLLSNMSIIIMTLSLFLGVFGSGLGLLSAKER